MTLMTQNTLLLSLADIARVAHVQRPVVTMWRKRVRGGDYPFPRPVDLRGEERFDALQVVEHLELTQRGNNPQVRDDAAAFAELRAVSSLEAATLVDGLTALLCLRAITSDVLGELSAAELLNRLRQVDRADTLLAVEVVALGADLPALAAHADALADASYSPAVAFELLLKRERHVLPGHTVRLHDDARRLVALVAKALAENADQANSVFVDPTEGGSDLLLSLAALYEDGSAPDVITGDHSSRSARLARRRLRVHDIYQETQTLDTDGVVELRNEAVTVGQFPPPGQPAMSDLDILDAIDNMALRMTEGQRAVLIGPASAFTDKPASDEIALARSDLLRTNRVRAVVRLPQGLMPEASRRAIALWALGPVPPQVPVDRRWTVLADLSNTSLTASVISDLVSDIVASMGDETMVRAHAFRYAVRGTTSALIAGRHGLVDRVLPAPSRRNTGAELAVRIDELSINLESSSLPRLRVEVQTDLHPALRDRASFTVGNALARKHCTVISGNRVDPEDVVSTTGATVIGTPELTGELGLGRRLVDRLSFVGSNPAARFTEPDDVVFSTSPRPAALVDEHGGSVVAAPARVLRISRTDSGGLVPHLLAADINSLDRDAKRWRLWRLRRAPSDQRDLLAGALAGIEAERLTARRRLADLDELAAAIADGVTADTITIARTTTTPKQQRSPEGQR